MPKPIEQIKDLEIAFWEDIATVAKQAHKAADINTIQTHFSDIRKEYLDKDAKLSAILKGLKNIQDKDEQKQIGLLANKLKQSILEKVAQEQATAETALLQRNLKQEYVDPTHPGRGSQFVAGQHILSKTIQDIEDIFFKMGFEVEYSYQVDTAANTFDALNIPENHPARDNWDTLWLEDGNLAIPHTSAMQNRILRSDTLPIKKIIIGKTFRNEATDMSHEHTFTQVEGVYLHTSATMSEMIGVLLNFFENYFEQKLDYKFSPDFFPFVEPGGQLAIRFTKKKSKENYTGHKANFLEVLGCGMIHPKVIAAAGKDPQKYRGFAWGFGVERIAMIKYNISNVRNFHASDLEFNRQFK